MRKTIVASLLMFPAISVYAGQAKLSTVQLGSRVGIDLVLCKTDTGSTHARTLPGQGPECVEKMPEYGLVDHAEKYRVIAAPYTFFGKLSTVETYQNRVWRARFELGKRYTEKASDPHAYVDSFTTALEAKTGRRPTVFSEYNNCSKGTPVSQCWSSIRKIWITTDAKYTLEYSKRNELGSLTFETPSPPYTQK